MAVFDELCTRLLIYKFMHLVDVLRYECILSFVCTHGVRGEVGCALITQVKKNFQRNKMMKLKTLANNIL